MTSIYEIRSLVKVPASGMFAPLDPPPSERASGYIRYPDGRSAKVQQVSERSVLKELAKTREQLAKAKLDNESLKRVCRNLKFALTESKVKEKESQRETYRMSAQLRAHRATQERHFKIIGSLCKENQALRASVEKAYYKENLAQSR